MARKVGLFYTGPPIDRNGPPIRIDLFVFYDPEKMAVPSWTWNEELQCNVPASPLDDRPNADCHLYRFRDPMDKPGPLLGLLKLLR